MNSGQRNEVIGGAEHRGPPQLKCANRSAKTLLVFLIFISLNIVAGYDWLLSLILKPFRALRALRRVPFHPSAPAKTFAHRVR